MSAGSGRTSIAVWALAVALVAAALAVPRALNGGWRSPDSMEHLAIAHALSRGAGFVDPVEWHYYLERPPPLPAAAARPPLVPLLAALPLAAGATVPTVIVLHALWSALVVGALFLVAARSMRPPAAAAAALLLATMRAWLQLTSIPLTEVTATACYLLVLTTADGVLRSVRGGLVCAAATILAALARPNFGALAVAVIAAAAWEAGGRGALRRRGLWAYALAFVGGVTAIDAVLRATTGEGLYAAYGVVTELFSVRAAWRYDRELVGGWTFVQTNAAQIAEIMRLRAGQLYASLFVRPEFHRVGWLAVPAVLYGLLRRRDGVLAHRIDAFAILGFAVLVVTYYTAYSRLRFPLPIAVPACLTGLAAVDAAARRLGRVAGGIVGALPLALVLWLWVVPPLRPLPRTLPWVWHKYLSARQTGPAPRHGMGTLPLLCDELDPNAIVAASLPWQITFWCGNATVRLPIDPGPEAVRDRFVAERRPAYIVLLGRPRPNVPEYTRRWRAQLDRSRRFRRLPAPEPFLLYEVERPPPDSRPWVSPGPVACAGLPRDCARRRARGAAR